MPTEESNRPGRFEEDSRDWSWTSIVHYVLETTFDGTATLSALYGVIQEHPRTAGLANWKAKVRQTLQVNPDLFCRIAPGTWSLRGLHSSDAVSKFEAVRRMRYPRQAKSDS